MKKTAAFTEIHQQQATMLVVIDSGVEAPQTLAQGVQPGAVAVRLDANSDAIAQITEALAKGNYTRLHLVSHGSAGSLHFANTKLTVENLSQYRQQLLEWGVAEILIYGCEVAKFPTLLQQLYHLTGANIAASAQKVGKGNWHLEWQIGEITSGSAFTEELRQEYQGEFQLSPVDTLDDENDGVGTGGVSLRDAINFANSSPGTDTITFNPSLIGGTINLTEGELRITESVNIIGLGARNLTIDAGGNGFRVFNVDDGNRTADQTVTLDGLTITGGDQAADVGAGGGILNAEILTISNSTITGNQAFNAGGIRNFFGATLNITNSTISDNTSQNSGGGIFNESDATLNITNSTISGNTDPSGGGAILNQGTATVSNTTISNNSSDSYGAVLNFGTSTFTVISTIIAGNNGGDIRNNFISGGNNLIGNDDGGSGFINGENGDIVGTAASPIDPLLGPLQDNGGPTDTQVPNAGSPALNAGSNPNGLTTDQNGNPRDDGNGVDIGAVECFLTGTRILTDKGEIAVESLKIGDKVVTAEGKLELVKWIGRQTRKPHQVRNPLRGYPILIKAGALGNNLPQRDLSVSPDHAMFVEGLLINAGALVNGTSILKTEPQETFTYYHVELENHALLLAEGASAESYLPQKEKREEYDNGAEYEELYPHGSKLMLWPMDYPRVSSKSKVPRFVIKKLTQIAKQLGLAVKAA